MSAPKLSTELRREQIARAALELYVREGAEGFSVAKLSKSVGLVPSAIYRHFHGKEEVLEASMDVLRDKLFGLVEAARDESSDPVRTLELLLKKHAALITSGKAVPHVLMSADTSRGHEKRRAKLHKIFRGYMSRIGRIASEGQALGLIRKDVEPETIALLFAGMIQPAALMRSIQGKKFDLMAHVSQSWEIFAGAIRHT